MQYVYGAIANRRRANEVERARRQISRRMLSAYYRSDEKRQVDDKRDLGIQL